MNMVFSAVQERAAAATAAVAVAASRWLTPALGENFALVAVGGFGRGELFPHSDADIVVLVPEVEIARQSKDALSAWSRDLWDGGWKPSHSVRTARECCQFDVNNVELTLSLLTQQWLGGSEMLYRRLADALPGFLETQRRAVTAHLVRLTLERWARFHQTIYHLEPDVKEAPGTLRDLHWIEWMDRLRPGVAREALDRLRPSRAFLYQLRWRLHERAGRNDNRLLFDAQDLLFDRPAEGMRDYFRHARAIHREAAVLMELSRPVSGMARPFLDWRSRLSTSEFTALRERVLLRNPAAVADPALVARLLQFLARHGFSLALDTERRLSELAATPEWEFPPASRWADLREMLQLPHAARAVRAMQETGLLVKLIPEWGGIECLVTRDFYHRYTVDEHTLVTLESLEQLAASKDDGRGLFRELLAESRDGALLRMALLLHDLGKGSGDGRHEEHSVVLARQVLSRLGAPEDDAQMILFLVAHHLDLSALMMGRDLHDPDTLAAAARRIGTMERLRLLTLLTYADVSGVHPGALTPWRLSQLASAYRSLYREFTRELDADRIDAPVSGAALDAFQQGFPTRYVLVHPPSEREAHLLMASRAAASGVAVDLQRKTEAWELTVVTRDRPRLFADLAGTLAGYGMNILRAEAFANQESTVVDIWRFHDPLRRLELNPEEARDLERLLARVVRGEEKVDRLLAGRPRPVQAHAQRLMPVVAFDPTASQRATLLEIVAADRPGLLYEVATAIYEADCAIEVVLVNTEAHRAIDVFYLTAQGAKLGANVQESLRRRLLELLQPH